MENSKEGGSSLKAKFNEISILSPLLMLYTVVYLGLMIYDFAMRGAFKMPTGMMVVYIALVTAYAADKEIRRWMGKEEPPRAGSFFVYLWLLFFLVAFVIRSFWPTFTQPADLSAVALQVLAIFFGSKASKKIYDTKTGKNTAKVLSEQDQIMELVRTRGKISRAEVAAALAVSSTTAWRKLSDMEKKGLLKQVGEHKDAYYVAAGKA